MDDSVANILSRGLDFGSARIQAIADNIANINTPGYKRRDVSFDSLLEAAQNSANPSLANQPSDPRYFPIGSDVVNPTPVITVQGGGAMREDGNNVDVDAEGAKLGAAQIYYSACEEMLASHYTILKSIVRGN